MNLFEIISDDLVSFKDVDVALTSNNNYEEIEIKMLV
jgi:hypothetical protein